MNKETLQGVFFGLTEGTVTTIGIIIGMFASTSLKKAIIGAVLAATVSDSFGDSIGLYYSEKASSTDSNPLRVVLGMVVIKVLVSLFYLLPIITVGNLKTAVICSLLLAFGVIISSLMYLADMRGEKEMKEFVGKNTLLVSVATGVSYLLGSLVDTYF